MLAVVDDQQQPPAGERLGNGVDQRGVALRGDAERGRDGRGHRRGLAHGRELDHPHSVGKLARELGAHLDREPGLADSADTAQGDQPVRSHEVGDFGDQVLATDERVQLLGQVAGRAIDAAKHGKVDAQPLGDDLEDRRSPTEAAEPMLAQRPDRDSVSEHHLSRVGCNHLAAVSKGRQPCRAAHARADVASVALGRLAGVQAHADRERQCCPGEPLLRFDRRARGVARTRERGAEAISDRREHVPVVALDRVAHDAVVHLQCGCHVGGSFLPRPRRVLDVGEQERHRAARQLLRHRRTVFQGEAGFLAERSLSDP